VARSNSGFTLAEVLIAMGLLAFGVMAAAPMFIQAMHGNASGAAIGSVAAAAEWRFEQLRATPFNFLVSGGSITANVTGYFDDSAPDVVVRWVVANNVATVNTRRILVRAEYVSLSDSRGPAGDVTLVTLRGR
jgi:prepilin-type N-terminal cleavage/methylation domain-containing protein